MELNKIYQGNSMEVLKTFPDESIDCCVTSPPYFGLRDYGTAIWTGGDKNCLHKKTTDEVIEKSRSTTTIQYSENNGNKLSNVFRHVCDKCGAVREDEQIGLEETPEEYVSKLVKLFAEVKRVLKPQGTLWLNIGDTYAAYWGQKYGQGQSFSGDRENKGSAPPSKKSPNFLNSNIKPKDLFGIPWMVAFALRNDGWYLRQDIIWHKPNPMPESVTDRCTKSHEYIFLLTKSPKYYYDAYAIKTEIKDSTVQRMNQQIEDQKGSDRVPGKTNGPMKAVGPGRNPRKGVDVKGGNQGSGKGIPAMGITGLGFEEPSGNFDPDGNLIGDGKANKRSVWSVTTKPFTEAHFATFPEDLIEDCIKAGTSEHGCCSKCGNPYKRMLAKKYVKHENWFGDKQEVRNSRGKAGNSYNELVETKSVGWKATCKCKAPIIPSIVLDPFGGAGTTPLVSRKLNRNYVAIELNPEYIKISDKRLKQELGFFV